MTLSPLESRITRLRRGCRSAVMGGVGAVDKEGVLAEASVLWNDPDLTPHIHASTPEVQGAVYNASAAGLHATVLELLRWLELCEALIRSERLAREPQDGGCFGVRK